MIFFLKQTCHSETGGGGVHHLGKNPTFSRFFSENVPKSKCSFCISSSLWEREVMQEASVHLNIRIFDVLVERRRWCSPSWCAALIPDVSFCYIYVETIEGKYLAVWCICTLVLKPMLPRWILSRICRFNAPLMEESNCSGEVYVAATKQVPPQIK